MANERITEDLERSHFKEDPLFKSIKWEEQKSSIKRVQELLKGESKGKGKGLALINPNFQACYEEESSTKSLGQSLLSAINSVFEADVNPLYLKLHELNPYIGLFLCTLIELDRYRGTYGRKWRPARMPDSLIKLPVDDDGNPDWAFMENFIKSRSYSKLI